MATLKEIAQKAGVSVMTVSNVVNGKHSKVSKDTFDYILSLIDKYDYVPNLNARSLVKKSSHTIVVFTSTFVSHGNVFKDPYLSEFFGELESFIRENGYYVLVQTVDALQSAAASLRNWHADGAIFMSPLPAEKIRKIQAQYPCPVVFVDSNDPEPSTLTVGINEFKGGYIATKYLLSQGHRRIGIAGFYDESAKIVQERYKGYVAALKEFGMSESDAVILHTVTTYEAGMKLGSALANHEYDITAVFATADLLALGIMEGARLNGCVIPRDLSLIGFDNLSLCDIVTPKLTSVSQDLRLKARSVVDLLFKSIEGKADSDNKIVCDVQLELRQSVQAVS
ncbi:MAG: LacI family DNA-binding transcriptional regulator [Treponema sp.]|nr:LacI family DNA-binding transcriptional regulator [Treponema sp.]